MANTTFFVKWALWEKMTFVLALGIVVVFCIGLGKLWWTNRLMRKQELLGAEKMARLTEMRRAGIHVKRRHDIPFGIRAIQHGIEVDGIWISRPATPNSPNKLASLTTLVALGSSDSVKKEKHLSDDSRTVSESTLETRVARSNSPSEGSGAHRLVDVESAESSPSLAPRGGQFAAPKPKHPRLAGALSEDTLWRLEGQGLGKYAADTYIPTSGSTKYSRGPSQRSSLVSSGRESIDSLSKSGMSGRSSSGRSYTSARSTRLHSSRNVYEPRTGYYPVSHFAPDREGREPFEPPRNRTPISPIPQSGTNTQSSALSSPELPIPEATFAPAELHMNLNREPRRVNAGFEVLSGGTFGSLQEFRNGSNEDLEAGEAHSQSSRSSSGRYRKVPSSPPMQSQQHFSSLHF